LSGGLDEDRGDRTGDNRGTRLAHACPELALTVAIVIARWCAMMILDSLQMSAAVFKAELRARGFQIRGRRVWDVSGVCPGFAITAVLRRGQ
jgi:hypothetical protein